MQAYIRLIKPADLAEVQAIQDCCYGDELFEDTALIESRLLSQPNSCWLAQNHDGKVLAYLFSYPSRDKRVAPLGSEFERYNDATLLYLHDMAVSPTARGLGLAPELLATAERYAIMCGLNQLALVAVQGSVPYWQKQGFSVVELTEVSALQALESYQGQNAVYMQKKLSTVKVGRF